MDFINPLLRVQQHEEKAKIKEKNSSLHSLKPDYLNSERLSRSNSVTIS